jgi:hypothetical protein
VRVLGFDLGTIKPRGKKTHFSLGLNACFQ